MREYRFVLTFSMDEKKYNMYLDNNNRKFFLRVDGDKLNYLQLEEFVKIYHELSTVPNVMNAKKDDKKKKIKMIPKIIIGGATVVLSAALLTTMVSMYESQCRLKQFDNNTTSITQTQYLSSANDNLSLNDNSTEEKEDLVVDTYLESDQLNYLFVYDMDYIDKVFDYANPSAEQLKEVVKNNQNISSDFKDLLYEYCDAVCDKYPDIDLRTFYENLKTLEVVECTDSELVGKTLSTDSYGCYVRTENKIYVKKDYKYEKGTWPYQVIFHEFSHCLRVGNWNIDGKKINVQVEGQNFSNTITAESLNSLFAVSLFDYDELDIAYQLQSNYHKVMIDCMDNYKLDDYVQHSLSYYANKLDECNGDENYATVILELIQMQYDDFHSTSINLEQSEYYPIYDYVSDMYYNKYLTSDMSYDDAVKLTDDLVSKILYDVPEDYNIDVSHFYSHLDSYLSNVESITSEKVK